MPRRLLQLFARNPARANGFRIVRGADPDRDAGQETTEAPDGDDPNEAANSATVYVYDVIGDSFWGDTVAAKDMVKQIAGLKAQTIHLRINSPGGDVFDARAIKTALEQHSARVVAHIDGLAASAASFLMLAADEIRIASGAFVMIHNPWTLAIGDAGDMRAAADTLDKIGAAIAADYHAKTQIVMTDIVAMMNAETWMDGEEAVARGFADRLMEKPTKAEARFDLSAYRNAPRLDPAPADPDPQAAATAFAAYETERARMLARLASFNA